MIALKLGYNKDKLYKTFDYWSRDMLNFSFPEKVLGLVSPPHSVYYFTRIMFFMLYSINWPNFIVSIPLFLEILENMCITFVCWPGCEVIQFEINLIFLIEPFCYMTKKSRQKCKYLEKKKSFWAKIKAFFIICKGLSIAKNCLWPESVPLGLILGC